MGCPLILRVIDRLEQLAQEIILIGQESPIYRTLGYRIAPDLVVNKGPLGGLFTALVHAEQPLIVVVGCDMPFASIELLTYELEILQSGNLDAVLPTSSRGLEPLHGIYRKDTCVPLVKDTLDLGKTRLISWLDKAQVGILSVDETNRFNPLDRVFFNINSHQDLLIAEQWVENKKEDTETTPVGP
jgi:molybdopterin-guanine dinucleotide biosynthesis protein A